MLWCRNTHLADRGVNTEMNIFDVLQYYIRGNVPEFDLSDRQYSFCALMMRKMRSTSFSFCNTSYIARLITFSRAWMPRQPSGRTCLTVWSILNAHSSFLSRLL